MIGSWEDFCDALLCDIVHAPASRFRVNFCLNMSSSYREALCLS